ncbi:MBL fold metallo-hydrolase [[Phormidium ambiguum] IAM M-71]|uniref:MBL fold metallo-hydrolase n=1 Tax=[Phormidium ambiguum] IAM M-71 TaxID=454136 RepID=A0A1U7ISF4_9CYAN|nr:MBL fold metallo-hydrolase [Phormidium ambiguum]OKH40441.1 MBL fold metallo-hydrolase [Phormidium ambiguum IAM M-71]
MENSHSSDEFVVQFWGVRGSIPTPGNQTARYGGNTSCIEMRIGGKRLIFDGGSGLHVLGRELLKIMPVEAYMFFTHYHWDHIQGVPMFIPAFVEGNSFQIYGAVPDQRSSMEQHFMERVLHPNSPVPLKGMQANIEFCDISCGDTIKIDDIIIETGPLNHPNGAMGYRVNWRGHSVFYCTDTEHYPDHIDENVLRLANNADLLIYDSMYTDEEYHNPKSPKVGWGHSTWEEGVKVCEAAGVKRFVKFHHEPIHSDDFLDRLEEKILAASPNAVLAKEGMILKVV